MKKIEEACKIVIAMQKKAYGDNAIETQIKRIRETEDVYVFDFKKRAKQVVVGGGGLLVYKKDMSATHYCLPSCPDNIFEIMDNATDVDIPKEYV